LLLVLLLLAIVGIGTTAACQATMTQASRAAQAQDDLQRRWGTFTVRTAILRRAEGLLSPQAISRRMTIPLTTQSFEILIADEQAKLNVNALRSPQRDITELIRGMNRTDAIRLSPRRGMPAFEAFAQIFPEASPADLVILTQSLTCFGNGELNMKRCSLDSLQARCADVLDINQIRKLFGFSREGQTAGQALDGLALSREKRDRVDATVTDQSTCHSVWIVAHTATRSWYYFAVRDQTQDEGHQLITQEW
jgi:hypothetical protein